STSWSTSRGGRCMRALLSGAARPGIVSEQRGNSGEAGAQGTDQFLDRFGGETDDEPADCERARGLEHRRACSGWLRVERRAPLLAHRREQRPDEQRRGEGFEAAQARAQRAMRGIEEPALVEERPPIPPRREGERAAIERPTLSAGDATRRKDVPERDGSAVRERQAAAPPQ